jgi:uncharacterized protein (TIGR02284 family)
MTRAASDHDIKILNSLIETTLASAAGYSRAAAELENATYRSLFEQWAQERRQVVDDLQDQLFALGGKQRSGTLAEQLMFFNFGDHAASDDNSMLHAVELGEDFIRSMYEEAIDDEGMSNEVRTAVVRAYTSVRSGHEQARDLKLSLRRY